MTDDPVSIIAFTIATIIKSAENRLQSAMPLNGFAPEVAFCGCHLNHCSEYTIPYSTINIESIQTYVESD
jgi:hypothetical protein